MNKNKNITYQNLQGSVKTVLRGKCIAINGYMTKDERSQINNLNFYLKKLGKDQNEQKEGRKT